MGCGCNLGRTKRTLSKRKGYLVWSCHKVVWRSTLAQARKVGRNLAIECGRSMYRVKNLGPASRPESTYIVVKD